MRTLLVIFFALNIFPLRAVNAQSNESKTSLESESSSPIDDHKNYFGVRVTSNPGGGLFYARRLGSQWLLGVSLSAAGGQKNSTDGGSLDNAQYYSEESSVKSSFAEINTTYYFRSEGFKRWGFLLRGGAGYAKRETTAKWTRYDRERAFIHLFGNDKRQLDSNEVKADWSTVYGRAGGYYQFIWTRKTPALVVGHILELGTSAYIPVKRGEITYTKPNGESYSRSAPAVEPMAEVSYSFVF